MRRENDDYDEDDEDVIVSAECFSNVVCQFILDVIHLTLFDSV